ncbi:MAG: DUF4276 family protein [Bacteroidales bacterium]|nr:DUF4276 family protein [Bacteroidales bacterium]MCF8457096.1 DUF4276 family protein [Bacteroidales bacterium]
MVDVTIFIEGGVLPHDNVAVQTIDNSHRLRESFHQIFSQIIDPGSFNLNVQQGSGFQQTINFFKSRIKNNHKVFLLIDLDMPKSKKAEKIKYLNLEDQNGYVFFMVQEMEAWILSQPDKIDKYYSLKYTRKGKTKKIEDDSQLVGKHPEDIHKPSRVLRALLKRYYSYQIRGKKKKKGYEKLKDGPDLLSRLDATKLASTFSDLKELASKVKTYS